MKSLEELKSSYLAKPPKYSRTKYPEPYLYKRKLLDDALNEVITLQEFDLIMSHYLEIKTEWQQTKNRFKALLLNMPLQELENTTITNL